MDILALLLGTFGVGSNIIAGIYVLAAFVHGRKQYSNVWFAAMKVGLDLVSCLFIVIDSWDPRLSTEPSTSSQLYCVLNAVHFWFWIAMTLRVGLNVIQAGYYFEWLVLTRYRIVRLIYLQVIIVATTYGFQAVLAAILHGMQSEHRKGESTCGDALFLEDKFESSTGLLKIAVLTHFVSFLTLPVMLIRYCYRAILMGLGDNDGIPDRVAYGEFLKLYYFDYLMFGFLSLPHMLGFFLYNFTPAFDFRPHTPAFKLTFYLFGLYPILYPVFSMHLLRIFRNPLSYTKDEVKKDDSKTEEQPETEPQNEPAAAEDDGTGEKKNKNEK
ncbi:unnamed protein product [Schistocephalus solidus]|uniref:G_PROTEIN_RECEP_F1_2 domain-containing protein n=1 Tax=Schistocephalus solidus TaxID=70667 RepID=A0A183TTJ9_SCHSO|nr:unnamed protein product [Schistocephalus solidus]